MSRQSPNLSFVSYVIVSPVKDEERHVAITLRSVVNQTVRPIKWVIVDDGSVDGTPGTLMEFAANYEWIEVVRIDRGSERDLGITEIKAFAEGYERIRGQEFDFVVKLDCDLDLPPDYFERLFQEFANNQRLGIASGVYLESRQDKWLPVPMPDYHAAGASKTLRRQCFHDIGGFTLYRGWDTIDEIKAMSLGWECRHFPELEFRHLKREGSAMGPGQTNVLHGEIYYLTGGGLLFFILKVVHRSVYSRPLVLGGLAMLWGYLKCVLRGKRRSVNVVEARFYRRMLNGRLYAHARRFFKNPAIPARVQGGE